MQKSGAQDDWEIKRHSRFPYLGFDTPMAGMLAEANYQEATILIHEYGLRVCEGLERGCFLLALNTRGVPPGSVWENKNGDPLPSWATEGVLLTAKEPERGWGGSQVAQRVLADAYKGDPSGARQNMDEHTRNEISFGALRCRILGTLRRREAGLKAKFAPDVSAPMFDTTQWIVVKPRGQALACIINSLTPSTEPLHEGFRKELVEFGRVRWALDERRPEIAMAQVRPADFLRKRTAVLGMTGQGKSNAVKLIALSIQIAAQRSGAVVGQLLFDPHGEYANETENDKIGNESFSLAKACGRDNAFIFTCSRRRAQAGRQLPLLLDFYRMPQAAHGLLRDGLMADGKEQSGWLNLFLSMSLPNWSWRKKEACSISDGIKLICWWGMLGWAGFVNDPQIDSEIESGNILGFTLPQNPTEEDRARAKKKTDDFKKSVMSVAISAKDWGQTQERLPQWIREAAVAGADGIARFDFASCKSIARKYFTVYNASPDGKRDRETQDIIDLFGDDGTLLCEMAMRKRDGRSILGMDIVKPFISMHWERSFARAEKLASIFGTPNASKSVPAPWVMARHLVNLGKLVIVDLSAGDEKLRKLFSETLANDFLESRKEQNSGSEDEGLTEAVLYLEEAHTLVGRKADADDLWPRLAKEGRKMKIGLVLSTQEPSGVNHYVLANAENFFVGYLNNDKELAEISGIGDLGQYTDTAKRGMEKGYFRVWCREARPYPLPLQLRLFQELAKQLRQLIEVKDNKKF